MTRAIIIKGGSVITVDEQSRVLDADIIIRDGRIDRIRERDVPGDGRETGELPLDSYDVIDASGCAVLPGFIQTHVHLCQTLMRGFADDLKLLDWLRRRVWPMEAAHSPRSLTASARLGVAEMIRGGTTTALTMETVKDTEAVFRAVEPTGFRA
ncbi:MAG TPA: amidohydrolase family protein, partial [Blastocatellia bacterium]|nr:amidohydrolase family protein [Blastocatellia bacterium]